MTYRYHFVAPCHHGVGALEEDFCASFTVIPGRPQTSDTPAERAGIEIVNIYLMDGDDELEIQNSTHEHLVSYLSSTEQQGLLFAAAENVEAEAAYEQADHGMSM